MGPETCQVLFVQEQEHLVVDLLVAGWPATFWLRRPVDPWARRRLARNLRRWAAEGRVCTLTVSREHRVTLAVSHLRLVSDLAGLVSESDPALAQEARDLGE